MHGDVKASNFVSLGVGRGYVAIDLDSAGLITKDVASQKKTSSGYLPPEQAALLYFDLVEATCQVGGAALVEKAEEECDQINQQRINLLALSGTMPPEELLDQLTHLGKSFEEAKQKVTELKTSARPEPVMASPQYDMWCFGVLLFRLCTNQELFVCDGSEEVVGDDELKKIKEWTEDEL